jgi:hypothetical protein
LFNLVENLVETTLSIPIVVFVISLTVTVLIAATVSLDVMGVIRSQYHDFQVENPRKLKPKIPEDQADLHASWHAGLFIAYMVIVNGGIALVSFALQWIPQRLIEAIARIFAFDVPNFDEAAMAQSTMLISSMLIILFVWQTYSAKIVENHESKGSNLQNPMAKQRFDVRFIFHLIKERLPDLDRQLDHAVALTVAVDMLAISALIRVYFEAVPDSGGGAHIDFLPWYDGSPFISSVLTIFVFSVFVYNIVFGLALRSARLAAQPDYEASVEKLKRFRFVEPGIVFFVMFASLVHVIGSGGSQEVSFADIVIDLLLWGGLPSLPSLF